MSLWSWVVLTLVAWLLLALGLGRLLGAMIKRRDTQHAATDTSPDTPVPPAARDHPER